MVKYGMEVMYRSKVLRHTLNPDWRETVSLTAPNSDEIITVVTKYVMFLVSIEIIITGYIFKFWNTLVFKIYQWQGAAP